MGRKLCIIFFSLCLSLFQSSTIVVFAETNVKECLETGKDWELIHLPTHADHFYDVHRIDFDSEVRIETDNCCHVMMLVEGESILIETADGSNQIFAYAETFVVPAAANSYKITNLGKSKAKVIKAFLK